MRLVWFLFSSIILYVCVVCKARHENLKGHQVNLTNGVEFRDISRGTLLKLLTEYEQQLKKVTAGRKEKQVFSAQFINNEVTNKFIYPYVKRGNTNILSLQPPDPPFWTRTSWLQLGYGVWVNMSVISIGLCFGFPAVTIPQLKEKASSIQITLKEEAWIVSILTLSSPIGSLLCGLLMDRYGRRLVLILCELPICFGWFYTGFASTATDIIIGRVIAGVGLGMILIAPRAYITEITLPNMRGVIGALPNLFISLGLTIQAALGSFLAWYVICYICGSFTLIMMVSNIFLPETPYFLLLRTTSTDNSMSYAKVNLRRFRSAKFNVDAELAALYDFRAENNFRRLSFSGQLKALVKPSACKPYGIVTAYFIFMQLAGVNIVVMWTVEILERSKLSLNANIGNLALALTRIFMGIVTSILLFKVGRRVMALISAIGVGIVAIGICAFLYTVEETTIFPLLMYMAYVAFATLGYYNLPFLMIFELLPLQIRGILSGICFSQFSVMMFGMNNIYILLRQTLGLPNTMAVFGGFSLLGALVLFLILPETKGLTLQEIEEFFNSRRPTLISQRRVMSEQLRDVSRMNFGVSKSNLKRKSSIIKAMRERDKSRTSFTYKNKESELKIKSIESGQKVTDEPVKKDESKTIDNSGAKNEVDDLKNEKINLAYNEKNIFNNEVEKDESKMYESKDLINDETSIKQDNENSNDKDKELVDISHKKVDLKSADKDLVGDLKDPEENDNKLKDIKLSAKAKGIVIADSNDNSLSDLNRSKNIQTDEKNDYPSDTEKVDVKSENKDSAENGEDSKDGENSPKTT